MHKWTENISDVLGDLHSDTSYSWLLNLPEYRALLWHPVLCTESPSVQQFHFTRNKTSCLPYLGFPVSLSSKTSCTPFKIEGRTTTFNFSFEFARFYILNASNEIKRASKSPSHVSPPSIFRGAFGRPPWTRSIWVDACNVYAWTPIGASHLLKLRWYFIKKNIFSNLVSSIPQLWHKLFPPTHLCSKC